MYRTTYRLTRPYLLTTSGEVRVSHDSTSVTPEPPLHVAGAPAPAPDRAAVVVGGQNPIEPFGIRGCLSSAAEHLKFTRVSYRRSLGASNRTIL